MNEVPAKQIGETMTTSMMKQQGTIKTKQQLLAKEVFSPQIPKFRRRRKPLYNDETWTADIIDKISLSKYKKNINLFYLLWMYSQICMGYTLKN